MKPSHIASNEYLVSINILFLLEKRPLFVHFFYREPSKNRKINLKEILGADYEEGMEIDEAALKKAVVEIIEPEGCTDISSFVMSLASDNPDLAMQELAVVNPIKSYGGKIKLKPSPSADATDYFAEKSVYVVLDASFLKDVDANVLVKGTFEFELKY